jgi:hypothetical protein
VAGLLQPTCHLGGRGGQIKADQQLVGALADPTGIHDVLSRKSGDCAWIEGSEGAAIVLALGQDRRPRKAGLGPFQDKPLKKGAVVMAWHTPLLVVVLDFKRITSPWVALKMSCHVATFVGTLDRSWVSLGEPSHGVSVSSSAGKKESVHFGWH